MSFVVVIGGGGLSLKTSYCTFLKVQLTRNNQLKALGYWKKTTETSLNSPKMYFDNSYPNTEEGYRHEIQHSSYCTRGNKYGAQFQNDTIHRFKIVVIKLNFSRN